MSSHKVLILVFSGQNGIGKTAASKIIVHSTILKNKLKKYFGDYFKIYFESFAFPLKEFLLSLVGSFYYEQMTFNTNLKDFGFFKDELGEGFSYRNFCMTIADNLKSEFSKKIFGFGCYLRITDLIRYVKRETEKSRLLICIDDLRFSEERDSLNQLKLDFPGIVNIKYIYLKDPEITKKDSIKELYTGLDEKDWVCVNNQKYTSLDMNLSDAFTKLLNLAGEEIND
jgi:hypothetical protein